MAAGTSQERRKHDRVGATVPATITAQGHTLAASTKDISARGLFLFTDAAFKQGTDIDVVLMLPPELGLPYNQMVCCHGTVVRVEVTADHCGIAAQIDRISDLPQV